MKKSILWSSLILLLGMAIGCQNTENNALAEASANIQLAEQPFRHGVASGDPLAEAVIIWTRVSVDTNRAATVKWTMATDLEFTKIVKTGYVETTAERDFTVKIDVTDLTANTTYFYKFELGGFISPIGRTKTAPKTGENKVAQQNKNAVATQAALATVRLAVVSCSNYEAGYYNAFAQLAKKENIDAVLHLGDYIYEYAPGVYGDTTLNRKHLPAKEIVTLSDYRTRYAQYRTDEDMQRVHQVHPFITIWDDHEIANNAHKTGGENHQAEEGDYEARKAAAKKAYYEWMPIREGEQLYRQFAFGDIVELFMLDERLEGRSAPAENQADKEFNNEQRSMLGKTQQDWLIENLKTTKAQWKVIGNQVIFSDLNTSKLWGDELNMDAWDGYPAAKQALVNGIADNNIKDVVFVSGDTHCSWAFEVLKDKKTYNPRMGEGVIAVEFGTPGITSSNLDEYRPLEAVLETEKEVLAMNPHLKYVDLHSQGYFILNLTKTQAIAAYYYMDKINAPSSGETLGKTVITRRGSSQLILGKN